MVRRLATSQARGVRQMSFINELMAFRPVHYRYIPIPERREAIVFGRSELNGTSWFNLKRRLVSVGFSFSRDSEKRTITMSFPETEEN